ncbi:MAG: phage holin family protein [Prevotella sp.]
MFSNDRNIETIGQLVEVLKHYIGLQTNYAKLDVIDKVVRLLTVSAMVVILSILLLLTLIYLSFAAAYALTPHTGTATAFCIVSGVHLAILILCILFRKSWFERPLVRFLASLLMS